MYCAGDYAPETGVYALNMLIEHILQFIDIMSYIFHYSRFIINKSFIQPGIFFNRLF